MKKKNPDLKIGNWVNIMNQNFKPFPFVRGGPDMEAFNKPDVIPVGFNIDDPFYDLSAQLTAIKDDVADGTITDLVIIIRRENKATGGFDVRTVRRGENAMTTALGMIQYADESLKAKHIRDE
jgi:hypothetical protein